MNLSIIAATVPSLYRSAADLHSGMGLKIPDAHLELANSGTRTKSSGRKFGKVSQISKRQSRDQVLNTSQTEKGRNDEIADHNITVSQPDTFRPADDGKTSSRIEHDPDFQAETGSSHASDGSEHMIIRQTRAWDVRYEGT